MSLVARAVGAAKTARPFLRRLAAAHRDADSDVAVAVVPGERVATERLEDLLGIPAARAGEGEGNHAIFAPPEQGRDEDFVEGLAERVRRGDKGSAVLVGPRHVRRPIERRLAERRVGVSSTIQVPTLDGRYGDVTARCIAHSLGSDRVAAGKRYPKLRPAVADVIIRDSAKRAAIAGTLPLPGADLPALFAIQFNMVIRLAALYGHDLDAERLVEVGVVGGSGFAFREVARASASAVPGAGWAVRGGVAYGGTRALGEAARIRFEHGGDLIPEKANAAVRDAIAGVTGK